MNALFLKISKLLKVILPAVLLLFIASLSAKGSSRSLETANTIVSGFAVAQDNPSDQTPTPTPTPDTELEQALREQKIAESKRAASDANRAAAEADKAAAEAEKAALETRLAARKARLGIGDSSNPATNAPTGNITGSKNTFIETQILAEISARKATAELKTLLCSSTNNSFNGKPITTLVINSAGDKNKIEQYNEILTQLKFLHTEYQRMIEEAVAVQRYYQADVTKEAIPLPLVLPAATGLVKSAADFINLFRTDTEFAGQTVSVDTRMVVTFLVNDLLTTNQAPCQVKAIYYPSIYPLGMKGDSASSQIMIAYRNLLNDMTRADGIIAENRRYFADAKDEKTAPNSKLKRLMQATQNLENFKKGLEDLMKLLTATETTGSTTVLAGLLRSERLKEILKNPETYALDLVVTSSGTNRITKNLFFNSRVKHSAGITINAVLFNNEDQLVFGENRDYYIEFSDSKEIRKRARFRSLEEIVNQ